MPKLMWDQVGERLYETGVSKGVLYPLSAEGKYPKGVAWNGLTKVEESPSGAEPKKLYANNGVYLNLYSAEELGATIESYMYPDEFAECNGLASVAPGVSLGQQVRKGFGFCYRTEIGNDTEDIKHGYKLHLMYGCKASPSSKSNDTINEDPNPATMSWEISTTPVSVEGYDPTASMEIDSTKVDEAKLKALEDILYGTEAKEASLPFPNEVIALFKNTEVSGG